MPSKTKAQERLMAGNCRRPGSMKKKVSRKVACEFMAADKRKRKTKRTSKK